jgi:hypothetical protein
MLRIFLVLSSTLSSLESLERHIVDVKFEFVAHTIQKACRGRPISSYVDVSSDPPHHIINAGWPSRNTSEHHYAKLKKLEKDAPKSRRSRRKLNFDVLFCCATERRPSFDLSCN